MNFQNIQTKISQYHNPDLALFLVRIAIGLVFVAHGWMKFVNMQGPHGTIMFFASLGIVPFFAYLTAIIEFFGGCAILLGVGIRYAGLFLAIVMAMAIYFAKFNKPFLGGIEYELTLLIVSLSFVFSDAGSYSIKRFLNRF